MKWLLESEEGRDLSIFAFRLALDIGGAYACESSEAPCSPIAVQQIVLFRGSRQTTRAKESACDGQRVHPKHIFSSG